MEKIVLFIDGDLGWKVVETVEKDTRWETCVVFTGKKRGSCKSSVRDVDVSNTKTLEQVLSGAQVCFIATETDLEDPQGKDKEVAIGKSIGQACKTARVPHVIALTYINVERTIGIPARHYDAKAEIYEHLKFSLQLQVTAVSVPPVYEYFAGLLKPSTKDHVSYVLDFPDLGGAALDMISMADAAECIRQILIQRSQFINKTVSLSGTKLTGKDVAATLSQLLPKKTFKFRQATVQEFRDRQFPGSIDYANMFEFLRRADLKNSVELTRQIHPQLQDFSSWAKANKGALEAML